MTDWSLALPGQIIVDNSFSPPTQAQHAAAKQFGVVANMRYSSDPPNNSKNLTREQVEAAWGVGVGSMMNQEQTSLDSLDGYQGGVKRAQVFIRQADLIGMPRTIPAVVSIDTSWHPKAIEYAMGFHDAMKGAGWEQTGCYFFGPGPCEQLLQGNVCSDLLWQAHAGSYWVLERDAQLAAQRAGGNCEVRKCPNRPGFEVIHNAAHCFQNFGYVKLSGGPYAPSQVDENEVRNPVRIWLPSNTPAPPPSGDKVLKLIQFSGRGPVFIGDYYEPGLIRQVEWIGPSQFEAYKPFLGDPIQIDSAALANTTCLGPVPNDGNPWPFFRVVNPAAGPQGQPGPAGPPGQPGVPGPAGPQGQPGTAASVDAVLAALKGKEAVAVTTTKVVF